MLQWSDLYIIGNERIDLEHQTFFSLIKKFSEAHRASASKLTLQSIIEEITLYAQFHFKSEENYMREIAYPLLEGHKRHHQNLLDDLVTRATGFQIDRVQPAEIEAFLVKWFATHVTHEDRKIADYVENGTVG